MCAHAVVAYSQTLNSYTVFLLSRILCFASNYNSNPVQCAFLHETFQSSLFIWQDQMLKLTVQPEFGGKRQFQDKRPKNIFDKSARGYILGILSKS